MKNAILPSVSSQLYTLGNIEPVSDMPVQIMDRKLNVYGSSFCIDPKVYDDFNQLSDGGFTNIPPHSAIDYQPGPPSFVTIKRLDYPYLEPVGCLNSTPNHDNLPRRTTLSLCKKLSAPNYDNTACARKRSIEVSHWGFNNLPVDSEERTTNKKKAALLCFQDQCHEQASEELKEIQRQRVPVRRSQKLSDKVTALQKLVSPYGKTDTASVLEEASISIKVLQDQIQKLSQMLSAAYTSSKPLDLQESGDKKLDLGSRGLCLVPLAFTQKLMTN